MLDHIWPFGYSLDILLLFILHIMRDTTISSRFSNYFVIKWIILDRSEDFGKFRRMIFSTVFWCFPFLSRKYSLEKYDFSPERWWRYEKRENLNNSYADYCFWDAAGTKKRELYWLSYWMRWQCWEKSMKNRKIYWIRTQKFQKWD